MKKKFNRFTWINILGIMFFSMLGIGSINTNTSSNEISEITSHESQKKPENIINLNEEKTIEKICSFQITNFQFSDDIEPPNKDSFYSHYQVDDPLNTYLEIVMDYKNLSTVEKRAGSVANVVILYNNEYEYDSFATIEDNGGKDFTYPNITNIDPLKVGKLHYICEIPKEILEIQNSIMAIIEIEDNIYKLDISFEKNTNSNESENIVNLNEEKTIEKICSFQITSFQFSDNIEPPNKDSFYSHYQVDDPLNTYLEIVMNYKNLSTVEKRAASVANVVILYNNEYEYDSFATIEDDGGKDFTYSNITNIDPLTIGKLHYICEIPKEILETQNSIMAKIRIANTDYELKIQ